MAASGKRPAGPGRTTAMDASALPSPVLIVDMGAFDANVAAAERWCRGTPKKIRPHVKAHRTPALALRQLTPGTSALARRAAVGAAIDAPEAAEALGAAARAAGSTVAVLVDIDVGLGRCGVPGPAEAVKLGTVAEQTQGLRLAGLMGYEGRQRAGGGGRAAGIEHAYAMLAEAKRAFGRAGLPVDTVSSAGTSTLREALADPVITV